MWPAIVVVLLSIAVAIGRYIFPAPTRQPVLPPKHGHYDWASFDDRLAERAMVVFMQHAKLQPGSRDMEFEAVAAGAYKMAKFMVQARK